MSTPIFQFLDTDGDGGGTVLMTGNYSVTAERFYMQNDSESGFVANRMIVQYGDATGWSPGEFANIGAALTNGVSLTLRQAYDDAQVLDLLGGNPIKENHHWARFCYDTRLDAYGAGNDYFTARWTFASAGKPLLIRPGQLLACDLNDDLTGLVSFTINVQGYYL